MHSIATWCGLEAEKLRLQEYVATLLGEELFAYALLHLGLLAACGILGREVDFLAHYKLALGYAGVALGEERAVLYRRSAKRVGRFDVENVGLIVVCKSLQGEVVGCYLLEHIANGVGKGCATRAECHDCGD
jgi:hypothetical protein